MDGLPCGAKPFVRTLQTEQRLLSLDLSYQAWTLFQFLFLWLGRLGLGESSRKTTVIPIYILDQPRPLALYSSFESGRPP